MTFDRTLQNHFIIMWIFSISKLLDGKVKEISQINSRIVETLFWCKWAFFYSQLNKLGTFVARICCPHGPHPSCQNQIPAQGNNTHLSFLKSFPSAVTFRTGISSILMFPISDSLKYICREKGERWRQADRERGRKRATLGQSHSWNTDLDKSGKHKHIVSGLKGEGGGAATQNIPPRGPQQKAGDPLIPPPHHSPL